MDRKALLAVALMVVIAIVPSFFFKTPPRPSAGAPPVLAPNDSAGAARARAITPPPAAGTGGAAPQTAAVPADTVLVRSDLYVYGISTEGGRLVQASLRRYHPTIPGRKDRPLELIAPDSSMLGGRLVSGRDTIPLGALRFTPSVQDLAVTTPNAPLVLTAEHQGTTVTLTYRFQPDDYRFRVELALSSVDAAGGLLLLPLGSGLPNAEVDSVDNRRAAALVTRGRDGATRHDFSGFKPGEPQLESGPFDWVAVKNKYFVTAVLAEDSAQVAGVRAVPQGAAKNPEHVALELSLPVPTSGRLAWQVYAGPMEYERLTRLGREFDDVNPYGWPGFRTLIRACATPVRKLLIWMHEKLSLSYGLVLVVFGVLIRVVTWPLNQRAMRASMEMQALQAPLQALQAKYKDNPEKLQQETFKLYKEHNVNPLGGCWPMLIPYPVMLALFFVLANSIELRGVPFLWIPDLARPDPVYAVPILMGVTMLVTTRIGQRGIPPNPQTQLMGWMMPVMFTVMFANFASGLNVYYTISNLVGIPQQWLLAQERVRRQGAPVVGTKPAPRGAKG